eukprot:5236965-Pleurochrysis_carterae.AAC.1
MLLVIRHAVTLPCINSPCSHALTCLQAAHVPTRPPPPIAGGDGVVIWRASHSVKGQCELRSRAREHVRSERGLRKTMARVRKRFLSMRYSTPTAALPRLPYCRPPSSPPSTSWFARRVWM